ncbi:MAG: hypothetical protein R2710_11210 [Acidimicrobiales bacterium]
MTLDERAGSRANNSTDYDRVRARLTQRADVISTRANERLDAVRRSYEIDDRALLQTQREVGRQTNDGLAPSTAEFWRSVASPLADRLADAAKAVIDEEFEEFAAASVRFRRSVRSLGPTGPGVFALAEADVSLALDVMGSIMLDPSPLDEVGERFQRRLRRTASRRLLPRSFLISPSETERIIDRVELELLDHPPYSHCDKLLVAFELAHADVRAYVRDHIARLRLISGRKLHGELE